MVLSTLVPKTVQFISDCTLYYLGFLLPRVALGAYFFKVSLWDDGLGSQC